jgi:hypothetical protein
MQTERKVKLVHDEEVELPSRMKMIAPKREYKEMVMSPTEVEKKLGSSLLGQQFPYACALFHRFPFVTCTLAGNELRGEREGESFTSYDFDRLSIKLEACNPYLGMKFMLERTKGAATKSKSGDHGKKSTIVFDDNCRITIQLSRKLLGSGNDKDDLMGIFLDICCNDIAEDGRKYQIEANLQAVTDALISVAQVCDRPLGFDTEADGYKKHLSGVNSSTAKQVQDYIRGYVSERKFDKFLAYDRAPYNMIDRNGTVHDMFCINLTAERAESYGDNIGTLQGLLPQGMLVVNEPTLCWSEFED